MTNPSGKLFDACIDKAAGRELFPFGYGLGYSDFESSLSAPALMEDGTLYSVTVTNRGEYPGKYVVPFYSTDAAGSRQGEFLGFGKTGMLRPHESQTFQYALKSAED